MPRKFLFLFLAVLVSLSFLSQGCGNAPQAKSEAAAVEADAPDTAEDTADDPAPAPAGPFKTFHVYTDANAPDNHYFSTGWMGDSGDLKMDESSAETPHGGSTCIKNSYTNKASGGARWVGVYWQNPPNNWGTRPGGYDLTGAKQLTFWARGEKGGERIEEFKVGGVTGEHPDSDIAGIGPVVLTMEWKQYTVSLEGKDLSSISGGFAWSTNLDAVPDGCVFYLDDIQYE